ncbi:MAG: hypothetical protein IJ011_02245 [Clostridia bacterium]|nr:hypothetical protein [Clostridia bacterium]
MENQQTFSSSYIGNKLGSVRVMFYNIYGYMWYPDKENSPHLSSGPKLLRQSMETELIVAYAPDVVGFQEYSPDFHKNMTPKLMAAGYSEVDAYHTEPHKDGTHLNYTPLFYRADTMRLIDKGFVMYPLTSPEIVGEDGQELNINDVKSKSLTWAVFEEIASGKRFIAVCTHYMYSAHYLSPEQKIAARLIDAQILLDTVNEIRGRSEYLGLPVIMGGDLNSRIGEACNELMLKNGMEWLQNTAKLTDNTNGIKKYATYDANAGEYITCPTPSADATGAIDHIFVLRDDAEKCVINAYFAVTDKNALLSSDHCPRITDITLN